MSSSGLAESIPTINEGLSIPELIKIVKHSFRECEFIEVQNILMDREKKLKTEMENLVRDRDSVKKEARLLERTQSLAELDKLKVEEKLRKSQKKCEELNEKIRELKDKNWEKERIMEVCEEKIKCLTAKIVTKDQEIEDLRHEKSAADKSVEELRRTKLEADQVVEEMKHQNLEATKTVDELRGKQKKADQAVEQLKRQHDEVIKTVNELRSQKKVSDDENARYKSRLESLEPRIMRVEESIANMLHVKVEDFADLADNVDKSAAAEGKNVDSPDFSKGLKDSSGNDCMDADAEHIVSMSPGVCSTSNLTGSGGIGLPKEGGRNLVNSSTEKDGANTFQALPGLQSGRRPPHVESDGNAKDNEGKEPYVSGSHASVMRSDGGLSIRRESKFEAKCPSKIACPSSAAVDIIEIHDSDDDKDTYSEQTNKRNRTDNKRDSPVNFTTKRLRRVCISGDEDNLPIDEKEIQVIEPTRDPPQSTLPPRSCSLPSRSEERQEACITQTPLQKFNIIKDVHPSDSEDESLSDSDIEDLVATVRSKQFNRT